MPEILTASALDQARKSLQAQTCFALIKLPQSNVYTCFTQANYSVPKSPYFVVKPWNEAAKPVYYSTGESQITDRLHVSKTVGAGSKTSFEDYRIQFEQIQAAITSGRIGKAILSRIFVQPLAREIDEVEAFERLAVRYPNALVSLVLHPTEGIWFGASPELLLERTTKGFRTVSLAGTAIQSKKPVWENKEQDEHAFVSKHIRQVMKELNAEKIESGDPYEVIAGPVVHLKTDFAFQLPIPLHSWQAILGILHPTPAIAGWPVAASVQCINRTEKHDRKLYGGFLGMVDGDSWEFFVNLRCAELVDKQLECHVGGGITIDSNINCEWDETTLKAATLLSVIGDE